MKKILIIGASILQLPAIKKAKEMGLNTAVVDYNPNAIGIKDADHYYNASTMDENAVVTAARDFKPDGIMTLATDMPMRGVAKASEALGLKSISYDSALKATDKYLMIKAFKDYGVASPWYYLINNKEDLLALRNRLSYPCIMKPTDNAGSHGVVKADSFESILLNYDYSLSNSRKGGVIIEEFLEGEEVSVEVMVVNGVVNILQITDKITTGAPHFVEMGHTQPSRKSPNILRQIKDLSQKAVKSLNINNGPCHVEMMVTNRGPVMVELGARMGGDNITTHLVPLSTGIDMTAATIHVALGETPDITPKINKGSAIRYICAEEGIIKNISGLDEAKHIPGVVEITLTKQLGDKSTPITCSNDRIGFVISQGKDANDAAAICEQALKMIRIEVE